MDRTTKVHRQDQRGDIPDPRVFCEPPSWDEDLDMVDHELRQVLARFGCQCLTLFDWLSVLGEEYGELCKAVNDYEFHSEAQGPLDDVHNEAIQVAAVAVHIAAIVRGAP